MKYKVGDTVRIKNERGKIWSDKGLMDKYMGREVTIEDIPCDGFFGVYDEDQRFSWFFSFSDIDETTSTSHEK